MEENKELTFGEKLIGIGFNPSKDSVVDEAKQLSAKLVNLVNDKHNEITDNGKGMASHLRNTLRTFAITAVLSAQMAVVKYLTWND